MTHAELFTLMHHLEFVFETVRLVNVSLSYQYTLEENGSIAISPYPCYAVWNKDRRCDNCAAAKAFSTKATVSKFEWSGGEIYQMLAKYVEADGTPYVLELFSPVHDDTLFGAYGKREFIASLTDYTRRKYFDPLTEVYNRRCYEEELRGLTGVQAVAMLGIDDFGAVSAAASPDVPDDVLCAAADAIRATLRRNDVLVRYGEDTFLLLLRTISAPAFEETLERLRRAVEAAAVPDCPAGHVTASIGGVWGSGAMQDMAREAAAALERAKARKNCVEITLEG